MDERMDGRNVCRTEGRMWKEGRKEERKEIRMDGQSGRGASKGK
jgi:hypothetical protein